MPPEVKVGTELAIGLARLYFPGAREVSALAAILAAVKSFNEQNGRDSLSAPSAEELDSFIAEREGKRIQTDETSV